MIKSKLLDLINLLTPYELNQLHKLVYSPFFNKHEKTRTLLDYIIEVGAANEDEELLSKETAFRIMFPGEDYDVQKVKDVMSPLTKLVETYLMQKNLDAEVGEQGIYLMRELRERKADKYFAATERQLRQMLDKQKRLDSEHFWLAYQLETEADKHFMAKLERAAHPSLQARADNLDRYYMLNKLKMSCEMINRSNIIKASYQMPLVDEIHDHIEEQIESFADAPVILAYNYNLLALKNPDVEKYYEDLIGFLNDNFDQIGNDEAVGLYDYAKNYCIKKINSGKSIYLQKLFEVYKSLINNGLIYQGSYMSQWDYKNIVTVATRLKAFEWCLDFIEQQRAKLDPQHRENAYTYNLAMYHYSCGNYEDTMELLRDVEFTDVYYNLGGKTTLMKTYYELNEMEAFFGMIDSFKAYLKRNKLISEYQYKVNNNLLRFAQKLAKLKRDRDFITELKFTKELKSVSQKIESTSEITNIDWLKEKVEELKSM